MQKLNPAIASIGLQSLLKQSQLKFFGKYFGKSVVHNYAKHELSLIVNKFKPDIIHTNIGPISIGYEVARQKNIPHIWHLREYQKLDFNINYFPTFNCFKRKLKLSFFSLRSLT